MTFSTINFFIHKYLKSFEMLGVLMRIGSFSVVSWLGPHSPFMLVWVVNTLDAVILTWCSMLKRDFAYTLLNMFWILIGIIGIVRAAGIIH
jgi:hypothetical protein